MMAHIEKDGFSLYIRDKDLSRIENIENSNISFYISFFSKAQKFRTNPNKQVRVSQLRIPVGGEIPEAYRSVTTEALQLTSTTEVWCRGFSGGFCGKKTRHSPFVVSIFWVLDHISGVKETTS